MQLLTKLTQSGHPANLHIMDNEAFDTLKTALFEHKIAYQLVPPHIHRRNAAKRAIQTFKNHFIAVLCSASPKFPARKWDRLLPQAKITMNLLRQSRFNLKLSAYAALSGPFDFNKTPIAPAGTRIVIHEKSNKRATPLILQMLGTLVLVSIITVESIATSQLHIVHESPIPSNFPLIPYLFRLNLWKIIYAIQFLTSYPS